MVSSTAEAYYIAGREEYDDGNDVGAMDFLQEALQLSPRFGKAKSLLFKIEYRLNRSSNVEGGE